MKNFDELCAIPPMKITVMSLKFPIACDQNNNFERGGVRPCTYHLLYLSRNGFAQQIDDVNDALEMNGVLSRAKRINGLFAQFSKVVEGVPLYISLKQRLQILQYYQTLLKNGYFECKYDRAVLERHLISKHEGYFKLAFRGSVTNFDGANGTVSDVTVTPHTNPPKIH
jgi:hypothetical protein